MTAPAVIRQKTVGELAREIMEAEGGMVAASVDRLQRLILEDDDLRVSIAEAAVREYAARRVLSAHTATRAAIWNAAERRAAPAKVGLVHLANGISASLLNFPLAGGLPLRAATREEVEAQAALYTARGSDMLHKARWLALIAARLPEGATVGEALDDDTVEALSREAAHA